MIVATTFPTRPGDGTPEFVLTLARSLQAFEVTVIAPRVRGGAADELIDGVRVRRIAYFPRRWEGLATDAIMPTLRAQPWRWVEVPCLLVALTLGTWREVRRQRAAVLNPHWILPAGLVALLVGWAARVPYVLTVHGADAYTLRGRMARRVKQLVLRRAAATAPVSSEISRLLRLSGSRSAVLRMGVDTKVIQDAVGDRVPENGLVVAVGRLADKKGFDVLIRALAQVRLVRLELIGDGPERARLETLAQTLGVDGRVRFRGRLPQTEVLAALRRAQVVAIPSKVGADGDTDGTPVVLCEAMAAGVPVVASELGGLREVVSDGETGLLVPPDDVDALADMLTRVAEGRVDLEAMGKAAALEAARSLDIAAIGDAYDQLLLRAVRR